MYGSFPYDGGLYGTNCTKKSVPRFYRPRAPFSPRDFQSALHEQFPTGNIAGVVDFDKILNIKLLM